MEQPVRRGARLLRRPRRGAASPARAARRRPGQARSAVLRPRGRPPRGEGHRPPDRPGPHRPAARCGHGDGRQQRGRGVQQQVEGAVRASARHARGRSGNNPFQSFGFTAAALVLSFWEFFRKRSPRFSAKVYKVSKKVYIFAALLGYPSRNFNPPPSELSLNPLPPVRSALAEQFLRLLPETIALDSRVDRAIKHPNFPGGAGYNALVFLAQNTLQNKWDRKNPEQTSRLQAMVTKAIGGDYRSWADFKTDLWSYLSDFGFTTPATPSSTSGPRRSTTSQRSGPRTPHASV